MDYAAMKMIDVAGLPGVKDIKPILARGKFAQALMAESRGEHTEAENLLNEAVAAELKG